MTDDISKYKSHHYLKGLVLFILSINLFHFSGLLTNNYTEHNLSVKTELVISKKSSPVNILSYNQVIAKLHPYVDGSTIPFLKSGFYCISQYHNLLAGLILYNYKRLYLNDRIINYCIPKKIISSHSRDDLSHLLLG